MLVASASDVRSSSQSRARPLQRPRAADDAVPIDERQFGSQRTFLFEDVDRDGLLGPGEKWVVPETFGHCASKRSHPDSAQRRSFG
jgi:hypothetical protein